MMSIYFDTSSELDYNPPRRSKRPTTEDAVTQTEIDQLWGRRRDAGAVLAHFLANEIASGNKIDLPSFAQVLLDTYVTANDKYETARKEAR